MCGIAGVIHRGANSNVGGELTSMLQSLKHRGPDSTGFALYGQDMSDNRFIMRFKLAEQEDLASGFGIHETITGSIVAPHKDGVYNDGARKFSISSQPSMALAGFAAGV